MSNGVVTRLEVPITPAPEPTPVAGVVATPTANGGVTVTKAETSEAPADTSKLILGKFKDHAALEAAYKELEGKLGQPKVETPAAPVAAAPTADAHAQVAKAGLDIQSLTEEFAANGNKLTDASMQKLAAAGITAEQVNGYIAGQQAIVNQIATDLQTVAGGEKQLETLTAWAKVNATKEQKQAFDTALATGNRELIKQALTGIKANYDAAMGTDARVTTRNSEGVPGMSGVQGFGSQAEMTAAMRDPRYKKGDRAYIKSVEDRIKASRGKLWGQRG
jgi:hypothetical protein